MSRKQRAKKQLKKSIPYFIVEGCTEENYIKLLKNIYNKSAEIKNTNGGNAKGVMIKALKIIKQNGEYSDFIVWFDNDRLLPKDQNVFNQTQKKAKIVQSYPCIESWILAHFQKINQNQLNQNCNWFENNLKQFIQNYTKNSCKILQDNISKQEIQNAIQNYPMYNKNIEYILASF